MLNVSDFFTELIAVTASTLYNCFLYVSCKNLVPNFICFQAALIPRHNLIHYRAKLFQVHTLTIFLLNNLPISQRTHSKNNTTNNNLSYITLNKRDTYVQITKIIFTFHTYFEYIVIAKVQVDANDEKTLLNFS